MTAYVNKNLVLVEPDNAVRSALKTLLQCLGWCVTALKTGQRLDSVLGKSDITAIISESSLPDRLATTVLELGRARLRSPYNSPTFARAGAMAARLSCRRVASGQ